jgi:hypothetical protein
MGKIGQSKKERKIIKAIKTYNKALEELIHDFTIRINSKEAKDVIVNFNEENPIKGLVGLSKKQTASADMETYLRVSPNTLKKGDYIQFQYNEWDSLDNIYLITSDIEREEVNDKLVFLKCNTVLNWKGLTGTPMENRGFPCVASNDSYGSKTSLTNDFLSYQDTKLKILVPDNAYTRTIKRNWRFLFGNSQTDVFKIIDITRSMDEGIITMIAKKDEYRIEDNFEMNMAFNEKDTSILDVTPSICCDLVGEDIIGINDTCNYQIINSLGRVVELTDLICEVSDNTLAHLSQTIDTISLTALEEREVICLRVKDNEGNILCSKNIYLGRDW